MIARRKPLTLFAFKAICLSSSLKDSSKRVAATVLDHFNHQTGRCDPSLDTIAELAGVSVRTVIRAMKELVQHGMFKCTRHGGGYHCNFYEPVWPAFEKLEAQWKERRRNRSNGRRPDVSLLLGQPCQSGSDAGVNQTFPINISKGTSDPETRDVINSGSRLPLTPAGLPKEVERVKAPSLPSSSSEAMVDAAERRWMMALQQRYVANPDAYAEVIEAIDLELRHGATRAELNQAGSGLPFVVAELRRRSVGDLP